MQKWEGRGGQRKVCAGVKREERNGKRTGDVFSDFRLSLFTHRVVMHGTLLTRKPTEDDELKVFVDLNEVPGVFDLVKKGKFSPVVVTSFNILLHQVFNLLRARRVCLSELGLHGVDEVIEGKAT